MTEKCTATCKDGSDCGAYPIEGSDKCRMHAGTSSDGSSHEGNDNAEGNDGGAPGGNGNASKHNLHADRNLFYKRLPEHKQAQVDKFEKALINRYQEYQGRNPDPADVKDLFEIAVGYVQRDYAREWMIEQMEESGNPMLEHVEMEKGDKEIEFDRPNAILEQIDSNRREDRMARKDKGVEKDPESQKAEAIGDISVEIGFTEVTEENIDEFAGE